MTNITFDAPAQSARDKLVLDPTDPAAVEKKIKNESVLPMSLWEMAKNTVDPVFLSQYIRKYMKKRGDILENRKLAVVDTIARSVVNRLQLIGWDWEGEQTEDILNLINDIDSELGLRPFSRDTLMRSEVQGITYMFVWPYFAEQAGEDDKLAVMRLHPNSTYVHPPEDGHSIWPEWGARLSNEGLQLDIYFETRSVRYTRDKDNEQWNRFYDLDYRDGWLPYVPIVPFVCESLLEPMSGIVPAVAPQVAINHILPIDAAISEFAGFPLRYMNSKPQARGSSEVDATRAVAEDDEFDDDDDDFEEDIMDVFAGAFIDIKADGVGEFAAAGSDATLGRVEKYFKLAMALCEVPLSYFEGTTANNSGELMRREIQPLLGKANRRIDLYTASYQRVWEILRAQGAAFERGAVNLPEKITPMWNDPAWPDDRYLWDLVEVQLNVGVPPEIAFKKLGLTPDEVKEISANVERRRQEERQQQQRSTERPREGEGAV